MRAIINKESTTTLKTALEWTADFGGGGGGKCIFIGAKYSP